MSPTCTMANVQRAVELIGSKWVLLILYNLCSDKKGFNKLTREIPGISPRVLSLRLKALAEDGLVSKTILPTTPPQVEYALTAKGKALKAIIESLGIWAAAIPEAARAS